MTTSSSEPHYAAFISYSHADEAAASQWQRWLESYRLPGSLAGMAAGGSRIGPVFRDRADLAAATDLTDAIRSALAQARALLVLCSPDAARSPWVEAEIRLFRDLHPDRPVLAVVVRGDPPTSMPPALIADGREPLAADMHKDADGVRLARLKIAAALAGVPLDALIQRDAQRKLTRVMAITGAVGVALIVMVGMTLVAINARNEANAQRQQAEGLVDYMLTDLRTRLRGVGRLDVMTAVNDRAMDYYRSQGDLSDLPPQSLEQRAQILVAMGEDDKARGDTALAASRFAEAHRTTASLLAQDPTDPDRLFAHAQSEYWMGTTYLGRREWERARERFRAYRALAGRLRDAEPDSLRALRELGYAEGNLCSIDISIPSVDARTLEHCRTALAFMQDVVRKNPDGLEGRISVANRHMWYANALAAANRPQESLDQMRRAVESADALIASDPANADLQDLMIGLLLAAGDMQRDRGRPAEASAYWSRGAQTLAGLRARDPANARWRWLEQVIAERAER
jgi:tetratricopeptide (TPR) repeat protein